MNVFLGLYDHSNGEQSISKGLYDRIFDIKGTGEERYQSFQVKIAALQHVNHTNWWTLDVNTESQNIDIRMIKSKHFNEWTSGHAFHSMLIGIAPDGVRWNDTKCWAQNRDLTTTATESSTKQSGSTSTATAIIGMNTFYLQKTIYVHKCIKFITHILIYVHKSIEFITHFLIYAYKSIKFITHILIYAYKSIKFITHILIYVYKSIKFITHILIYVYKSIKFITHILIYVNKSINFIIDILIYY